MTLIGQVRKKCDYPKTPWGFFIVICAHQAFGGTGLWKKSFKPMDKCFFHSSLKKRIQTNPSVRWMCFNAKSLSKYSEFTQIC